MAENRVEVAAGAVVLVLALAFAAYAGMGMGLSAGTETYDLRASFRSIQGVSLGSDVKLAGVKVGTLSQLTLNPDTYMADAVINIDKRVQLPTDSAILISSEGLLGGNFIELQFGQAHNWPLGSALSIMLLIIVTIALLFYVKAANRGNGNG